MMRLSGKSPLWRRCARRVDNEFNATSRSGVCWSPGESPNVRTSTGIDLMTVSGSLQELRLRTVVTRRGLKRISLSGV